MKRKLKVLLYSYEGSGLGHLTRLFRLSEHLKDEFDVLLVSPHQAMGIVVSPDVHYTKLPSAKATSQGRLINRSIVTLQKNMLNLLVRQFLPDIIITDHRPRGLWGELGS